MTESLAYSIARTLEGVEIRQYTSVIIATVRGLSDDEAFGLLFDYISGSNRTRRKIAMTTPVISSEKIAMTAPVISGGNSFSFVMPSQYTMETIPEPLEGRIAIENVRERFVAVLRFKGRASRKDVEARTSEMLGVLAKNGIKTIGEPFLMRYNPPFMPGFLRRNEVAVEIVP